MTIVLLRFFAGMGLVAALFGSLFASGELDQIGKHGMIKLGLFGPDKKPPPGPVSPLVARAAPIDAAPLPAYQPPPEPPPLPVFTAPNEASPQQKIVVSMIQQFASQFRTAGGDNARGGLRRERGRQLCEVIGDGLAHDWLGRFHSVTQMADGKGALVIDLGDNIYAKTWEANASDARDHTLLPRNSSLLAAAGKLQGGQSVLFSGSFLVDRVDCLKLTNATAGSAMTEPEFLFRFDAIRGL